MHTISAFRIRAARPILMWLLAVICVAAFAAFAKGYYLFQATMLLSYALALVGLNLLTGYNGQISLGHGAFYAVGAYGTAILMEQFGFPYWLAIPTSALISFIVGFLFGFPALRLQGLYLALATFALGIAMPQLLKYRLFEKWTGGVQGIALLKPDAPFGLPLTPDQWLFLFSAAICALMFWLAHNLLSGSSGRSIRAIRDHSMAAEAMGINISRTKTSTFALSAAYTAVAGALSGLAVQFVAPDSFSMFLSITLLVGMVVGGMGRLMGAVYGAVFIMVVPTVAENISQAAPWAAYGVILIVFMFLLPGGVVSLFDQACVSVRKIRKQAGIVRSGRSAVRE